MDILFYNVTCKHPKCSYVVPYYKQTLQNSHFQSTIYVVVEENVQVLLVYFYHRPCLTYIENPHYKNPQENVKSLDGESFLRVLTSRPQHYVGLGTDTNVPIWLNIIFAHLVNNSDSIITFLFFPQCLLN